MIRRLDRESERPKKVRFNHLQQFGFSHNHHMGIMAQGNLRYFDHTNHDKQQTHRFNNPNTKEQYQN